MVSTRFSAWNRRLRDGTTLFTTAGYTASILYALIILVPLYFVIVSSWKSNSAIFSAPLGLPDALNMKKYLQAQENVNLLRAVAISFGVTTGAEILTLLLAFPAAYALARISTRLSHWLSQSLAWVF
jgi:multiple sugar transport system permease protein